MGWPYHFLEHRRKQETKGPW